MTQTLTPVQPEQRRFTVEEYDFLFRQGILGPEERVELIEGVIYRKMTRNPPHMIACSLLLAALTGTLPPGWFLVMQCPVASGESLPEPDGAIIRGRPRDYHGRRWSGADAGLVVEVADTTLTFDRGTKQRVYAGAGIPVYWIVNLVESQVEVFTVPAGAGDSATYRVAATYVPGDQVPLLLDGETITEIAVSDLLP